MPTPDIRSRTDRTLVRFSLEGNQIAQSEIVRRYQKKMEKHLHMMVGNRQTAEDLVQESFAKAFDKLQRYKPEGKFEAWLMTITHRVGLDYLRQKEVETVPVEDDLGGPTPEPGTNPAIQLADPSPSPLRIIEVFEALWKAMGVVEKLPKNVALCYLLRTQKELSFKEIAVFMSLPETTVRKYVSIGSAAVHEASRDSLDSRP